MQPGTLLLIKILSSLLFSKLNISTMHLSGLLLTQDPGPFSGLPLCRSKPIYATTPSIRFMLVILPFGQLHGALSRTIFMIISSFQSPLIHFHPKYLTSGYRALNPGTFSFYPQPSLTKPLKLSLLSIPLTVTTKISFVGHPPKMAFVLLKTFTGTSLPSN